ncbi:MAG TPA: radical SAM protein [Longimicrobium sp.]|jgi:hypothetical protein|nr:radical SAM protein [Longimicrobium sp.]
MVTLPREHRNSFGRASSFPARWVRLGRAWYALRAGWRKLRISRLATRLLGRQYRRSRDRIEIDITYLCNLHCLNCNRSVRQAREALHMPVEQVRQFVEESIARRKRWSRIRVLGGEPTLHPEFLPIIEELRRYRAWHPECVVEVVTNGHGPKVQAQLQQLPKDLWVENSKKIGPVQPSFGPFNLAPVDDAGFRHADFSNGCAIIRDCGMGLTPLGYYPCAVAGGIDRITGNGLGRTGLPGDADDMEEALRKLCRLCGRFRDGHYVPKNLRPPLEEEKISPAWKRLYAEWHERRRRAPS